jgi:hypothetical protein
MRIDSYKCDHPGCGKIRGEVNRWWTTRPTDWGFLVAPFDTATASQATVQTFCGEEHVQAALARFMQDHKVDTYA